jgi:mannose-6-phosphate isomerase-like protein (cupin superfamily)
MSTLTLAPHHRPAPTSVRAGRDLDIDLVVAARRISYRPALWRNAVRFEQTAHTHTRIPSTGLDVEAWLLTWLPGQHTELHDHGGSRGAFVVVTGTLDETSVEQDWEGRSTLRTRTLEPGDLRSFGTDHVHRISNHGDEPAVSIHVYAPSPTTMRTFELDGYDLVELAAEHRDVNRRLTT